VRRAAPPRRAESENEKKKKKEKGGKREKKTGEEEKERDKTGLIHHFRDRHPWRSDHRRIPALPLRKRRGGGEKEQDANIGLEPLRRRWCRFRQGEKGKKKGGRGDPRVNDAMLRS